MSLTDLLITNLVKTTVPLCNLLATYLTTCLTINKVLEANRIRPLGLKKTSSSCHLLKIEGSARRSGSNCGFPGVG